MSKEQEDNSVEFVNDLSVTRGLMQSIRDGQLTDAEDTLRDTLYSRAMDQIDVIQTDIRMAVTKDTGEE